MSSTPNTISDSLTTSQKVLNCCTESFKISKVKLKRTVVLLYQKRESSFFKQAKQAGIKDASP